MRNIFMTFSTIWFFVILLLLQNTRVIISNQPSLTTITVKKLWKVKLFIKTYFTNCDNIFQCIFYRGEEEIKNINDSSFPKPDMIYSYSGNDINCHQNPLTFPKHEKIMLKDRKFAYVWYVVTLEYSCSALIALKKLKKLRSQTDGN